MSIIPALGILSQEDIEFKVGLGYIVRTCQRKRRGGRGTGEEEEEKDCQNLYPARVKEMVARRL
jgi:hypothetical protein